MTTTADRKTCKAITNAGKPCNAAPVTGSDYCYMHDPALAADRAEARRKGGKARAGRQIAKMEKHEPPPAALNTHGDMLEALEHALQMAFDLEPSNQAVRSIVSVVTAAAKIYEVSELAQRIEALEHATYGTRVGVKSNGRQH